MSQLPLILTLTGAFASAFAQTTPPGSGPGDAWARVTWFGRGAELRLETRDGSTLSGPLESATASGLRVYQRGKPVEIKREEISKVWRLVPPKHRKWVTISAVSAGVFAGLALNLNEALRDDCDSVNCRPAAAAAAVVLVAAPIGGGIAAWKLSGRPTPVLIYSAAAPAPSKP